MKVWGVLALFAAGTQAFAQYSGPAILTRGETPSAMKAVQVRFKPFASIGATYDTGLNNVALNDQGDLAHQNSYATRVSWGIQGSHRWLHSSLGLDYFGSYSRLRRGGASYWLNQQFMLGYTRQLTRHATLTLNESAGMFSRDFGLLGLPQTVPFDPATTSTPTTDFFDNRTTYTTSQAGLSIERSTRLSFSAGGGGYFVRRSSSALYGTNAASARGDVQYRWRRRTTVGAAYGYQYISPTQVAARLDAHTLSGTYSHSLSSRVEFAAVAGGTHYESKFLQTLPLDPVIAVLLGISSSSQIIHTRSWTPTGSARLSWLFPHGIAYLSGGRILTPGNGLFLGSLSNNISAGYMYGGLRHWTINSHVSYYNSNSVQNVSGEYSNMSGAVSISRTLLRNVQWFGTYSARQYTSGTFTAYNRVIHQAVFGLAFSPGETPLRIW